MTLPISNQQVQENINPIFANVYAEFRETHIQSNESIFAAANCSVSDFFGFFIVTNYRAILVSFRASWKRKGIRYYKEGGGFFSTTVPDERFWFPPSSIPLQAGELKDRWHRETLLSEFISVERKEYTITSGGKGLQIVELGYSERSRGWFEQMPHTAFQSKDGQNIYNLIQIAIQNGGRLQPIQQGKYQEVRNNTNDMVSRIENLITLYRNGHLTDEEFKGGVKTILDL